MGSNEHKVNIPMCAACILLFLTLVSCHLTSGLYARYTTSSTSSDSARVAKFSASTGFAETEEIVLEISPGDTEYIDIWLESDTETAVYYSISVSTTGNLPLEILLIDGEEIVKQQNAPLLEYTSGALAPGETAKEYQLLIRWPAENNDCKYSEEIDRMIISLSCEQVD